MNLKLFKLILVIICSIPLANCNAQFIKPQGIDDVFSFSLPASVSKLNDANSSKLITQMSKEASKLADQSKTAKTEQFTEQHLTTFAGYATATEDLLIIIYKNEFAVKKDRDAMLELNTRRINWGIANGYLLPTSKGVTKLIIDGIPCLLMDIVLQTGERLQTYTFFTYYKKLGYAIVIKTTNSSQAPYTNLIKNFIASLHIKI